MPNRITEKQLQHLVNRINDVMGTPLTMFPADYATNRDQGRNEGHYCLNFANGGVSLHQVGKLTRNGQGERDTLECGHTTRRDLFNQMHAYLRGAEAMAKQRENQ